MVLMAERQDCVGLGSLLVGEKNPLAEPENMIGLVRFTTHKGEPAEAILDLQGRWRCSRLPVLERPLNILYDPRRFKPFGVGALHAVAAWLNGTARFPADGR
jgi:hypothetical protein